MLCTPLWKNAFAALAGLLMCATAQADILAEQVAAQGLIVPKDGLIYVAAPAGRTGQAIVEELKVKAGDAVTAGQTIALLQGRAAAEADVAAAQADAAAAAQGPAIIEGQLLAVDSQVAAAQADVATAEAQVKTAEAAVAQAQAGVAQAQAGVNTAQKARREAMETLDASLAKITGTSALYQQTLDEYDPPRRETEEIKFKQKMLGEEYRAADAPRSAMGARLDAEVAAAEAAVKTAEAGVAAAQADVAVAQTQVEAAQAAVANAEAQRAILQAELKRAQSSAEAAEAVVLQAQAAVDLTEVLAPSAGTVLHVGARAGEAVGPMGLVTLGDLSELFVEAEVYIDDARKVKAGQKVVITSDAFEGEHQGEVVAVGLLINPQGVFSSDPVAYSDKRVIIARIQLSPFKGFRPPVHSQVVARITVGK